MTSLNDLSARRQGKISLDHLIDKHLHSIDDRIMPSLRNQPASEEKETRHEKKEEEERSLIASMAARLSQLERTRQEQRVKLVEMEKQLLQLEVDNSRLRSASSHGDPALLEENRALRRENEEMKKFLEDYGLRWVGPGSSEETNTINFDISQLVDKLAELSELARSHQKPTHAAKEQTIHTIHSTGESSRLAVKIFKNGILVRRGPFREFGDPDCKSFLNDVMDGYFPSEFKTEFPQGVIFDVEDHRYEEFNPDCREKDSLQQVSQKIPRYVIRNGNILRPRESFTAALGGSGPSHSKEEVLKSMRATECGEENELCRVRVHAGKWAKQPSIQLVLHKLDTVKLLKELVAKHLEVETGLVIHSRTSKLEDDHATLLECECWPHNVLYARQEPDSSEQ